MIIFRVDANSMIGRRHMARCVATALNIKMRGGSVLFVTREDSDKSLLTSSFIDFVTIPSVKLSSDEGREALEKVIEEKNASVCVVDSADVSKVFFKELKTKCKVVLIEDYLYEIYDVDLVVNCNIYVDKLDYPTKYPKTTETALGLYYAPIQNPFGMMGRKKNPDEIKTILITTGDSDPDEICPGIVDCILDRIDYNVRLRVISSKNSPTRDLLYKMSNTSSQIIIEQDVNNMDKLINVCDLAVVAADSIVYDCLNAGIPCCVFTCNSNQQMLADTLFENDLCIKGGDYQRNRNKFFGSLVDGFDRIMEPEVRQRILENIDKIGMGNGSDRLAGKIMEYDKKEI